MPIADKEYELYQKEQRLEHLKRRTVEIERLFRKIYEDNANGKITDEQFYRLSEGYGIELADAKTEIDTLTEEVSDTDIKKSKFTLIYYLDGGFSYVKVFNRLRSMVEDMSILYSII